MGSNIKTSLLVINGLLLTFILLGLIGCCWMLITTTPGDQPLDQPMVITRDGVVFFTVVFGVEMVLIGLELLAIYRDHFCGTIIFMAWAKICFIHSVLRFNLIGFVVFGAKSALMFMFAQELRQSKTQLNSVSYNHAN